MTKANNLISIAYKKRFQEKPFKVAFLNYFQLSERNAHDKQSPKMCDFDNLGETVKFNSHLNSNFMSNCQHQQHLRGSVTKADCTISNVHPYQNCEKLEISKLILENPLWQEGNSPNRIGFNFVMTLCRGYFWISLLTLGYEMRPSLSINRRRIF